MPLIYITVYYIFKTREYAVMSFVRLVHDILGEIKKAITY